MLHLDEVMGQDGFGSVYGGRMKSTDGWVRPEAGKVRSDVLDDAQRISDFAMSSR